MLVISYQVMLSKKRKVLDQKYPEVKHRQLVFHHWRIFQKRANGLSGEHRPRALIYQLERSNMIKEGLLATVLGFPPSAVFPDQTQSA